MVCSFSLYCINTWPQFHILWCNTYMLEYRSPRVWLLYVIALCSIYRHLFMEVLFFEAISKAETQYCNKFSRSKSAIYCQFQLSWPGKRFPSKRSWNSISICRLFAALCQQWSPTVVWIDLCAFNLDGGQYVTSEGLMLLAMEISHNACSGSPRSWGSRQRNPSKRSQWRATVAPIAIKVHTGYDKKVSVYTVYCSLPCVGQQTEQAECLCWPVSKSLQQPCEQWRKVAWSD